MMASDEVVRVPYENIQGDDDDDDVDDDHDESPPTLHITPPPEFHLGTDDSVVSHRWNHIHNLDEFFRRIYYYHQHNGFLCIITRETLELFQYIFIIVFSTFLIKCVNYSVLFSDRSYVFPFFNTTARPEKRTLSDAVYPVSECLASPSIFLVTCWIVASIFWLLRLARVGYHVLCYWEIRSFYLSALGISSSQLPNMSWHEVQRILRERQGELHICVHKQDLAELDIYHRILRFKNYMVAMVNKSVLPLKFRLPFIGDVSYLSQGLKYNYEFILFCGPWSPFQNGFHLKDEYKRTSRRKEMSDYLARKIFWIGIINLIFSPLILLWQILYSFFSYADLIKRDPSLLGARRWSIYGRFYLRHFNELEHELNSRLNRAYKSAAAYMNIFTSPLGTIAATNLAFLSGSLLAVLVILTVIDEDVLTVEHVLTIMTVLGVIVTACRTFMPDENQVWCPETLLTTVLAHVHYMPDDWKGQAHTLQVRGEFAHLYQYKLIYLLEELISPIVTPFLLLFHLRWKSQEIVDFFRHFTVDVAGVGDVCSFAQMDVKQHGNYQWYSANSSDGEINWGRTPDEDIPGEGNSSGPRNHVPVVKAPAENGKTELSLLHFSITNPTWKPNTVSNARFLSTIKENATADMNQLEDPTSTAQVLANNPLTESLYATEMSFGGIGTLRSINNTLSHHHHPPSRLHGVAVNRLEGPAPHELLASSSQLVSDVSSIISSGGILKSLNESVMPSSLFGVGTSGGLASYQPLPHPASALQPTDLNSIEMSFSTLYMHQLHHQRMHSLASDREVREMWRPGPVEPTPGTSLLGGAISSSHRTTTTYGGTTVPGSHTNV